MLLRDSPLFQFRHGDRKQGFAGLRTAGEMGWAMRGHNECDEILEYEKLVEKWFPQTGN